MTRATTLEELDEVAANALYLGLLGSWKLNFE